MVGFKPLRQALLAGFAAFGGAAVFTATACPAYAQEATRTYNIEAQDLNSALREFAIQTGRDVLYPPQIVAGKRSPGVQGQLTERQALEALLAGTGLRFAQTASNGYAVQDPASPTQLGAVEAAPSYADNQEEIVVVGTNIRGIANRTAPTDVITTEEIDRSGYATTQDLVRSVPENFSGGQSGATEDGIFGPGSQAALNYTASTGVNLRGLGNTSTLVLVNGQRLAPAGFGDIVDVSILPLSAIERVEILTDGSSAIYGSDAVAGVVNFVLRDDYDGAESRARFGSTTDGGRTETTLSQSLGGNWLNGGFLLALQYQHADALAAEDRDFASNLPQPTDLLPESETVSAAFDFRHQVANRVEARITALLSDRTIDRQSTGAFTGTSTSNANTFGGTVGGSLDFEVTDEWSIRLNGQFSQVESDGIEESLATGTTENDLRSTVSDVGVLINGELARLPGGPLSVAAGAAFRTETLDGETRGSFPAVYDVERDVTSLYAEVYAPLVSPEAGIPLLRRLDLSAAVRFEDYSDFGETTNPRFGLLWEPVTDLGFRVSYSTSFRAPSTRELVTEDAQPGVFVTLFADPAGPGTVPVLQYFGGGQSLEPETAETWAAGFDYTPAWLDGLRVSLNYFDISYEDRIISPPFNTNALIDTAFDPLVGDVADDAAAQAIVDDILAQGGLYFDFVGTGVTGVRYTYDGRQRNAGIVDQSGFDASIDYEQDLADGVLSAAVSATYIAEIETAFLPAAPSTDLVGTFGNPLNLRIRGSVGWNADAWGANASMNYYDSYTNTASVGNPPIDSWTTVDLRLHWRPIRQTEIALSVANALDEDPPFVDAAAAFVQVSYDPANASPLGRFIALEVRQSW